MLFKIFFIINFLHPRSIPMLDYIKLEDCTYGGVTQAQTLILRNVTLQIWVCNCGTCPSNVQIGQTSNKTHSPVNLVGSKHIIPCSHCIITFLTLPNDQLLYWSFTIYSRQEIVTPFCDCFTLDLRNLKLLWLKLNGTLQSTLVEVFLLWNQDL